MINRNELPTREFRITDEKGREFGDLDAISIVTEPAIESEFMLFAKTSMQHFLSAPTANEKRQITGPVMIPGKKMLREDPKTGEYFMGWFSEDTIQKAAANYLRRKKHNQANLEHSKDFSNDFNVIESWFVIDPANDKANALGFKDLVTGTWFVTYQVKSQTTWNMIKDGKYRGFSVEVEAALFSVLNDEEIKKQIRGIVFNTELSEEEKESQVRDLIDNTIK